MHVKSVIYLIIASINLTTIIYASAGPCASSILTKLKSKHEKLFKDRSYFGELKDDTGSNKRFIKTLNKKRIPKIIAAVETIQKSEPIDYAVLEKILSLHQQCSAALIHLTKAQSRDKTITIDPIITSAYTALRTYKEQHEVSPRQLSLLIKDDRIDEHGHIQYPDGREKHLKSAPTILS